MYSLKEKLLVGTSIIVMKILLTLIYYCNATKDKDGGTEIYDGEKHVVTSILRHWTYYDYAR